MQKKKSKKQTRKNFLSFQSCPVSFCWTLGPFPKTLTILPFGDPSNPTCEMVCRIMCARLGWLWRHAKHAICKDRPKDILTDRPKHHQPPQGKRQKKRVGQKKVWLFVLFLNNFPEIEMLVWVCSCDYYICSMILLGSEHIYDPKGGQRQDRGCGLWWFSQPVYCFLQLT